MAETITTWGRVQRPWGFEVRVDFDNGHLVLNESVTFPREPSDPELTAAIDALRPRIAAEREARANPPPSERDWLLIDLDRFRQLKRDLKAIFPTTDAALAMTKAQLLQVLQALRDRLLQEVQE